MDIFNFIGDAIETTKRAGIFIAGVFALGFGAIILPKVVEGVQLLFGLAVLLALFVAFVF